MSGESSATAFVAAAGLLSCMSVGTPASAQGALTTNDFRIDVVATPVLGGSRVVGLSGAYTALAEGIDGVPFNPAGYAARFPYEHDWYEYELTLGVQLAGAFTDVDYFLNGQGAGLGPVTGFYGANAGGRLQFGRLGVGGSGQLEVFDIRPDDPIEVSFVTFRIGAGYNLLDDQLAVGVGVQVVSMSITENEPLVDFTGFGVEAGAVLRLADRRWRAGLMVRTPADARIAGTDDDPTGPSEVAGFVLPRSVNIPWEIRAGFAWQFFERPFNPRFSPPKNVARGLALRMQRRWCEREREQALAELASGQSPETVGVCPHLRRRPTDRRWWEAEAVRRRSDQEANAVQVAQSYAALEDFWDELEESRARRFLLVSADLRILGRVPDGVGIDAFIAQERARRGERASVGFHLGVESEPWPHQMKVRGGIYFEPARYSGVRGRLHGTFGFDFRLFEFLGAQLRAGFYIDGARDWLNWGISLGGWH